MLGDIVELKIKMLKLRAIFIVEFCYNLATIGDTNQNFPTNGNHPWLPLTSNGVSMRTSASILRMHHLHRKVSAKRPGIIEGIKHTRADSLDDSIW